MPAGRLRSLYYLKREIHRFVNRHFPTFLESSRKFASTDQAFELLKIRFAKSLLDRLVEIRHIFTPRGGHAGKTCRRCEVAGLYIQCGRHFEIYSEVYVVAELYRELQRFIKKTPRRFQISD